MDDILDFDVHAARKIVAISKGQKPDKELREILIRIKGESSLGHDRCIVNKLSDYVVGKLLAMNYTVTRISDSTEIMWDVFATGQLSHRAK